MPQFSYDPISAVLGQLAVYDPASIDTLVNTLPAQASTITTGGTVTNGLYQITVVGEEGTFTAEHTRSGAETTADVTDALAVNWASKAANANIATMTSDTVSVNSLAFLHAGSSYTITVTAPAPGTLVAALVTDPAGSNVPLGIFVVSDDGEFARLPTTGDIVTDLWGITIRNAELVQELALPAATDLEFLPAAAMGCMRAGEAWVAPEVAVSVNDPVYVRIVATGTEQAGALSNVADGGDNIIISGRWKSAAAAGELALVVINLP